MADQVVGLRVVADPALTLGESDHLARFSSGSPTDGPHER